MIVNDIPDQNAAANTFVAVGTGSSGWEGCCCVERRESHGWAAGNLGDLCNITPLSEKGEVSPIGGDIPLEISKLGYTLNVPCFPNVKTTILLKEANHVVRSIT